MNIGLLRSWLIEKLANNRTLFFVFDACEELCSQARDGFRFVERHLVVHLTALKVAGLTARLKDGLDLGIEVELFDWRHEFIHGSFRWI